MEPVPALPDFNRRALGVLGELGDLNHTMLTAPECVDVVSRHLRQLVEEENVASESVAAVQGDAYYKRGESDRAEAAWSIAARIRMRRPRRSFEESSA